ncbi:MFS transporter [Halorientalis marina]|uniref:MFS transporter n=1 Tax=Halorientalis marina TaxID=2931976 RepID=UPI001FF5F5F3|nr:MFS transporter [Halorientalis marina]
MSQPTASVSSEIPWRSGVLYVVLASSLMGVMGVSLISPVLPELRSVFGVTDGQVGLLITVYTLPGAVIAPFAGLAADRFGRRRVLVPLLFTFGIAGAGIAFVTDFRYVLGLRFLQGIGASALITLAITIVGDAFEGTQRDALIGVNGSVTGAGAAVYPLLGGALAAIRWNVPFLFFGVGVLAGVFALLVLEPTPSSDPDPVFTYLSRLEAVARMPSAIAVFVALFAAFFVFYGAVLTALPLLLSDQFGLGSSEIGPLLSAVAVASALVSSQYGRIGQWRSPEELVALGFVAYGVSLVGVWLAPSPLSVGASLLVFGVGFGILIPSIDTTVVTLVSADLRAGMMGLRTSVLRLGQTVGPLAFTATADGFFASTVAGYRALIVLGGATAVVAGVCGYALLRRHQMFA